MKAYVTGSFPVLRKRGCFFLKTVDNVDNSVDNLHKFAKALLFKEKNGLGGRFLELFVKWIVDNPVYNLELC